MSTATAGLLLEQFDHLLTTPEAVEELNRVVLTLAVHGKLVVQDSSDERATAALKRTREWLSETPVGIRRGKWLATEPVQEGEEPFSLPRGWTWARINDVGFFINGLAFKPSDWKTSGTPIIRIQNLTDVAKPFNYALGPFDDDVMVRSGDLLVSWSATLETFLWERGDAILNQHIFRVLPAETLVDRRFLYHLLRYEIREMSNGVYAHGLVMTHINRGPFLAHVIPIPPLAEQHRIVTRVEGLFAQTRQLAEKLTQAQVELTLLNQSALAHLLAAETLEDFTAKWDFIAQHFESLFTEPEHIAPLRQAILELAMRGKLTHREAGDKPASMLLEQVRAEKAKQGKDEELPAVKKGEKPFDLPEGWEWTRFGNIVTIATNSVQPKDFLELPHIAPNNIEKGTGRILDYQTVAEDDVRSINHHFFPGQLLYSKIRPNLSKAVIADVEGLCSADMYPLDVFVDSRFLLRYILSDIFLRMVTKADTRVAMPKVNQTELNRVLVAVPPLAEQDRIVARVEHMLVLCDALEAKLRTAREERMRLTTAVLAGVGSLERHEKSYL